MLVDRKLQVIAAALAALSVAMTLVLVTAPGARADTFAQSGVVDTDVVTGGGLSQSSDGCQQTYWSFQAYIDIDGRPSVDYSRTTSDICFGEHRTVVGHTYDAVIEISGLHSARVVATISLTEWPPPGQPAGEVRIDNTFTAFGAAETGQSRLVDHVPGTSMFLVISNGRWRQAESTGALPLDFAAITNNTSVYLQVYHDV
jgi:hypothetical protein